PGHRIGLLRLGNRTIRSDQTPGNRVFERVTAAICVLTKCPLPALRGDELSCCGSKSVIYKQTCPFFGAEVPHQQVHVAVILLPFLAFLGRERVSIRQWIAELRVGRESHPQASSLPGEVWRHVRRELVPHGKWISDMGSNIEI